MGWFIATIFFIIVVVIAMIIGGAIKSEGEKNQDNDTTLIGRLVGWGVLAGVSLFWGIISIALSFHQVEAGHVGLVYSFGEITGQREAGLQLTWPWQDLKEANTQVQTLCFFDDANKCPEGATQVGQGMDSFSKETQNVYIDTVLNIEVSPDEVQSLYTEVGSSYINKLIPGRIAQIFKDETVLYSAIDIAPNREQITTSVEEKLRAEMKQFSINISALNIENITFDAEFESAITQKQVATQESLREEQLVEASRFKANQKIEQARGDAESLIINAEGQANANRLIAESVTPALIQFQAIQKLADNIQIALIPSGQGVIIDPTSLFGTTPAN